MKRPYVIALLLAAALIIFSAAAASRSSDTADAAPQSTEDTSSSSTSSTTATTTATTLPASDSSAPVADPVDPVTGLPIVEGGDPANPVVGTEDSQPAVVGMVRNWAEAVARMEAEQPWYNTCTDQRVSVSFEEAKSYAALEDESGQKYDLRFILIVNATVSDEQARAALTAQGYEHVDRLQVLRLPAIRNTRNSHVGGGDRCQAFIDRRPQVRISLGIPIFDEKDPTKVIGLDDDRGLLGHCGNPWDIPPATSPTPDTTPPPVTTHPAPTTAPTPTSQPKPTTTPPPVTTHPAPTTAPTTVPPPPPVSTPSKATPATTTPPPPVTPTATTSTTLAPPPPTAPPDTTSEPGTSVDSTVPPITDSGDGMTNTMAPPVTNSTPSNSTLPSGGGSTPSP